MAGLHLLQCALQRAAVRGNHRHARWSGSISCSTASFRTGPHIQSGKLCWRRDHGCCSSTLPEVPTIAEAALPGYEVSPGSVFALAGTPAGVGQAQPRCSNAGPSSLTR